MLFAAVCCSEYLKCCILTDDVHFRCAFGLQNMKPQLIVGAMEYLLEAQLAV